MLQYMERPACPHCHSVELNNGNCQYTCKPCGGQFAYHLATIQVTDDTTGHVASSERGKIITFKVCMKGDTRVLDQYSKGI